MSSDDPHIVDTVVLLYFLLVERFDLLVELMGDPIPVPFSVYDPEEPRDGNAVASARSDLLSEMRQAIRHYQASARSTSDHSSLERVARVDALSDAGRIRSVPMTEDERNLAASLQSRENLKRHGIRYPLGPGEAACVAIAHTRRWTIATDDTDALTVMKNLNKTGAFRYERIRKLLTRAANERAVSQAEANGIHAEMGIHGFWDAGAPFP